MKIKGHFQEVKGYWIIDIPELKIVTQALKKEEVYEMIKEAIELTINHEGFEVTIKPEENNSFSVESNNPELLSSFMDRRNR